MIKERKYPSHIGDWRTLVVLFGTGVSTVEPNELLERPNTDFSH